MADPGTNEWRHRDDVPAAEVPVRTPPGSREGSVPRFRCIFGASGALLFSMIRPGAALLLLSLVPGCATSGAGSSAAGSVLLESPDPTCEWLGPMAVRMSSELLMSEDALLATAVNALRERAAIRGATHLVVAHSSNPAVVAYGTTAAASGEAYRCPDWH